jgi:hypothetical protein
MQSFAHTLTLTKSFKLSIQSFRNSNLLLKISKLLQWNSECQDRVTINQHTAIIILPAPALPELGGSLHSALHAASAPTCNTTVGFLSEQLL